MPVTTRIQPIDKDIAVILKDDLSPEARSKVLAQYAEEALADGLDVNEKAIGRIPPYQQFVDGRPDAPLDSVKPDGHILIEFDLFEDAINWIAEQLVTHSPIGNKPKPDDERFSHSFLIFADDQLLEPGTPFPHGAVKEVVFINTRPYARKIERGLSPQTPDGVFHVVAVLAQGKFGNSAKVQFTYRTAIADTIVHGKHGDRSFNRTPAIVVTMRG